jgi:putative Holliday junction resolvase
MTLPYFQWEVSEWSHMKILAVDLGDAHTGLACCDRTETLASPIGVIHERNVNSVLAQVAAAVVEYQAGEVVVGLPKNMNNSAGPKAKQSELFAERLRGMVEVPVKLWDERSTTVTAHQYLNETETRGKKRKAIVDAVAATIILESYLAYRRNQSQ